MDGYDFSVKFFKAGIFNLFRHYSVYNEYFEFLEKDKDLKQKMYLSKYNKGFELPILWDFGICSIIGVLLLPSKNLQICMYSVKRFLLNRNVL